MARMNPVKVLAAAEGYISANSEIDKNSVEFIEMPAKFVTKAHITDIKRRIKTYNSPVYQRRTNPDE